MIATATTKHLLALDAALPQRDKMLSESIMARRFSKEIRGVRLTVADECRVERVKYRFGKSVRILYNVRFGNENVKVAARTFNAARLAEIRSARKTQEIGTGKSPDFFDEELQAAFWVFPNDRKISNLSLLTQIPEDISLISGRVWKRSRIVAYAPEKCVTVQCLDGSGETIAYAKVFAGDDGRAIFDLYRKFSGENLRLPQALAYSDFQQTLILEAIRGTRVAELGLEKSSDVHQKFGAAVAAFHQIKPTGDLRPFKRLSSAQLSLALQTMAKATPAHAFQAADIFEKLNACSYETGPDVCLHGDLHAKNAIWNDGELILIDLDQVSTGDAAIDIGSFLAGLHYKERTRQLSAKCRAEISQEFLAGYSSIRPLPEENVLRRCTAAALFAERALRAVTRYRIEGLENMGRILAAAEKVLSGGEL